MSKKYEHATIIEKANVYFDGKVNSRTIQTAEGQTITLGFMQSGMYTFNTEAPELMTLINGSMKVKLPSDDIWKEYTEGSSFSIPAQSHFNVKIESFADYSCIYLEE